jgi:hypothetical protein
VKGKPSASPSGPHDCKDVHVRVRLIRLSMAEREESLPLHDLQQLQSKSTAQRVNHKVGDNGNVCNDGKGHRDDSERNVIGGDGDAMHDDGQKQVPSANDVIPHRRSRTVEVVDVANNIPVYWDSPEATKLFGFNYDEGCNVYNGLVDRCELLRGVLRRPKGFK